MMKCRICKNPKPSNFLSLGPTPLANSFLKIEDLVKTEPCFPLDVVFCQICGLVQLDHVVPPEVMFRDYIYVSSTSRTMPQHFASYADEIATRFVHAPKDIVLEIGSNDGCLLRAFQKLGVRTLGVEPASNLAEAASAYGIETVNDFFCTRTAREVLGRTGPVTVIVGNNVLAHMGDLHDVVAGMEALLGLNGVAVFEVPYLLDTLQKNEFDTIYHEHLYYFSLRPLMRLFESGGMRVFDAQRVPVHGGSLRIYVARESSSQKVLPSVANLLSKEEAAQLDSLETYQAFARNVKALENDLMLLLREMKGSGGRLAGYGAPAKGNTLLNHFRIGVDILDFIVDRNPRKQGMYTPGMHIPVVSVERLLEEQPDYALVLAWNFAEEIVDQQQEYLSRGGKFIVPIPKPSIVSAGHDSHIAPRIMQ